MNTLVKIVTILVLLTSLLGSFVSGDCPPLLPGASSNAKCVSKTQFVLGFQDPDTDPPLTCPAGTVCADVPEICSATAVAECINTVPGTNMACNECASTTTSLVCKNATTYAFCINGKVSTTMVYSCASPTPNCKVTTNSVCTAATKALDCPQS